MIDAELSDIIAIVGVVHDTTVNTKIAVAYVIELADVIYPVTVAV